MKNRHPSRPSSRSPFSSRGTAALAASSDAIRRNNFGADLLKQGRLDEAAKEFQLAVQADPRYATAHLNLAFTYDRLGRADEAIAAYKKAAELDPSNGTARNNLGVLYMKKEMYDEAIATLEQGLKIDPANATFQNNLESAKKVRDNGREREAADRERAEAGRGATQGSPGRIQRGPPLRRVRHAGSGPGMAGKGAGVGLRRSPVLPERIR